MIYILQKNPHLLEYVFLSDLAELRRVKEMIFVEK